MMRSEVGCDNVGGVNKVRAGLVEAECDGNLN
jgi:hypothetical protein